MEYIEGDRSDVIFVLLNESMQRTLTANATKPSSSQAQYPDHSPKTDQIINE
jgi:hypothetical protein